MGRTGIFLDTSRAVWDGAGKIIRYQGTLVDVTERRKMEKALRQQEEFQRYLLESFPDLILVIDLEGRYSFVSSRIRDLLGRTPADLLGKKVDDAEQEQSAEFVALYRDVSTGAKKFGFCEYGARHRDGSWRTMRANASPLFDAEGKASGVIVSVRDITVEKKAGTADHPERTPGGHGADDRRLRPRTEQSAHQHPGGGRTSAGRRTGRDHGASNW